MNRIITIITLCLFGNTLSAQTFDLQENWWETDLSVSCMYKDTLSDLIYLSGFNYIGHSEHFGVPVEGSTGIALRGRDNPNDNVLAAVGDGNGGWYIGGEFTKVGDSSRLRIAHIDQNGYVLPDLASGFNGPVRSLVVNDNKLYVGGEFTNYGSAADYKPYGSVVNSTDGSYLTTSANPNNSVSVSVPDGNGGWYLGGVFTQIGGLTRNRLAHVNSLGEVTDWNPNADGTVTTIVVSGSMVYVGGNFTMIGGQSRSRIAAIDAVTGLPTSWNPGANTIVYSLAMGSGVIYAGGNFSTIGGQSRAKIAAIDVITGLATAWNPTSNNDVRAVAFDGTVIYAVGEFTTIGGQTRNRIAALDPVTGLSTSWNPNSSGTVYEVFVSGSTVYAGGSFSTIGGQSRSRIAALDATTGLATPWNPSSNGIVTSMFISGNLIYVTGSFTTIGGSSRNRVAALDLTTGFATSWNPNVLGTNSVSTVSVSNSGIYVGGSFTAMGGLTRIGIVSIDLVSDEITSWNPGLNSSVFDIEFANSSIYIGGLFTTINGQSRNRIASLDSLTGSLTPWNPNSNNTVSDIEVAGSVVYVGGLFTSIGGQSRSRIAAIDAVTGLSTSWNPNSNAMVNTIEVSGTTIYVGGSFSTINGQNRNMLASFDLTSGVLSSWNPITTGTNVYRVIVSDQKIYVGGVFDIVLGEQRSNVAVFDESTGLLSPWQSNVSNGLLCFGFSGSRIYLGGGFKLVGGAKRKGIAAVNAVTGEITSWNPQLTSGGIKAMVRLGNTLYLGGSISLIDGQTRYGLAAYDLTTGLLTPWAPTVSLASLETMTATHTAIFIGGSFGTINGVTRESIAALDPTTGQLLPWSADLFGTVYDLDFDGKHLYAAGGFQVEEMVVSHSQLVAFDTLVGNYTAWDSNSTDPCYAIDIVGNTLYVGGAFTYIGGQSRQRLAAFNLTTGLIKPWNPGSNGYVTELKATDATVFVSNNEATFTQVGGQPRRYFAAIDAVTGQTLSWDPCENAPPYSFIEYDFVSTIETAGNMVFLGGLLDTISDVRRSHLAVYNACFSTSSTTNQFACNSYTWNGTTYTTSGLHSATLTNSGGCDSIAYLNLTIGNSASATTVSSCNNYTWPTNGQVYTASGTYSHTLQNVAGCDSVVTLNLSIHNASSGSFSHTVCESYTWPLNNQTYTVSGSYSAVTQNVFGCDSTVMLNLTILNESSTTIPVSVCGSYTWPQNNQTYTSSGQHTITFTNMLGCDSLVTLDLTILPATTSSVNALECVSYTWPQNNQTYTSSGQYADTITNATGCDSIITLNLTILNGSTTVETVSACNSYTWNVNGITYTASGQHSEALTSVLGCDSLVTLDLTITPPPTATATDDGFGTLTGSAGNQMQWIDCITNTPIAGATAATFSPTTNGTYAIVVSNGANCSDTSNCLIIDYIGLNENNAMDVTISPNPTTGEVVITFSASSAIAVVTDAHGKHIFTQTIISGESILLVNVETGVYFFELTTEQGKTVKRVVKN